MEKKQVEVLENKYKYTIMTKKEKPSRVAK